jgi:uncharacterized membrane protein
MVTMTASNRLRDEPTELRRVALSLLILGLVGFSLVLTCQMGWLAAGLRNDFAERNTLGVANRVVLLLSLAAGLLLPVVCGLFLLWRSRDVLLLERAARASAPLAALFAVPALFLDQLAQDKPLYYLIALSAFGLIFSALVGRALSGDPPWSVFRRPSRRTRLRLYLTRRELPRALPVALLVVCAAGYVWFLGHYAVLHHRLIQDVASDVGVVDNALANMLHGRWFRAPVSFGTGPGNYLTRDAEYGAFLFLPFYALRPGVETLLWLQVALAALAALPLYLVAARQIGHRAAIWMCFAYLSLAPLHGALLVGFSWLPAVNLFALTLYYAIESNRRWLLIASLLALLSISQLGPLYAFGLGLMLMLSRTQPNVGARLVALALPLIAWNLMLTSYGPGAQGESPLFVSVIAFWKNPVYFAWDMARAAKLASLLHALAPFALLPVLEAACWPLLIPGLLFTSAGGVFWPNASPGFANGAVWAPGCVIALLFALKKRRRQRAVYQAAILTLTITLLSHSYDFGAFLRSDGFGGVPPVTLRMTEWGQSRYESLNRVLARIPASASVGATTYLVSHVSNRPDAFDLAHPYGTPDYLLLSSREVALLRAPLSRTFAGHGYKLVLSNFDEFYLFKRAPETPETRAALIRLGVPPA